MTFEIRSWGGIGDALLMTPALRALRQLHPRATIRVRCRGRVHLDVLRHNPNVDVLKLVSPLAGYAAAELEPVRRVIRSRLRLPPPRARQLSADYIRAAPGIRGRHATEIIGDMFGVVVADRRLELWLSDAELARAAEEMRCYDTPVIIHVRSRCNPNQDWPLANWPTLIAKMPEVTFLQLGTRHDPRVEGAVDLRGRTTLRQAFALLKHARAFVGVVSAMAHASNAVGTPAVVLFGPSPSDVWGHANVIPVSRGLRCAPCVDTLFAAACPYGAPCLTAIEPSDVRRALRQALAAATPCADKYQ